MKAAGSGGSTALDILVARLVGLAKQAEDYVNRQVATMENWNRLVDGYADVKQKLLAHKAQAEWVGYLPVVQQWFIGEYAAAACSTFAAEMRPIIEALGLTSGMDAIPAARSARAPRTGSSGRPTVFVVHGHDEEMKQAVARFIEKLGMETTILHEQADAGKTLIEKFEGNADVDYAVVLLSPDDVGHVEANPAGARPRARQNVLFELGYFCGKLGRGRTCLLIRGDVEVPSDLHGVLPTRYESGEWRTELARNMKAAGLAVDLNKVL